MLCSLPMKVLSAAFIEIETMIMALQDSPGIPTASAANQMFPSHQDLAFHEIKLLSYITEAA